MSRIRLYMDEDSMDQDLVRALRARGVDVRTPLDDGMTERADEEQLRWATRQQRVLYTSNVRDFYRLHADFLGRAEDHAGLVLARQGRYAIGDQMRGLLRLMATRSAEDMHRSAEFLSTWIEAARGE